MSQANSLEWQMLDLINQERAANGLNALLLELRLNDSSEEYSVLMLQQDFFSHNGPEGSTPGDRMEDAGFVFSGNWTWGENLAWQSERGVAGLVDDVEDLHNSLMNSPGHRANILNPNFEMIGIGIEFGNYSGWDAVMVTQNFATTDALVLLDNGGGAPPPQNFTLTGTNGQDTLIGGYNNDTLIGKGGNDILNGGSGADNLQGGGGQDRADYVGAGTGFTADLGYSHLGTGDAAGDSYSSIEDLAGSNFGDSLRGDNNANVIWGRSGNDIVIGRGGNDTLYGGNGNDILNGGNAGDILQGGSGRDRADYVHSGAGFTADLGYAYLGTGEAAGDSYSSIEDLAGSNFGDSLRGENGANVMWGRSGNDVVIGRGGNDTLYGGNGNDILNGGNGGDILQGGNGRDRVDYVHASSGVVADLGYAHLGTGQALGDRYGSIEDLAGSNAHDSLRGDSGANTIWGRGGNDWLVSRGGNDTIHGGSGSDTFVFSSGRDKITDFKAQEDALRFDVSLWTPSFHTAQSFFDTYAQVGAKSTVFDFGNRDALELTGFYDPAALVDSMVLV